MPRLTIGATANAVSVTHPTGDAHAYGKVTRGPAAALDRVVCMDLDTEQIASLFGYAATHNGAELVRLLREESARYPWKSQQDRAEMFATLANAVQAYSTRHT